RVTSSDWGCANCSSQLSLVHFQTEVWAILNLRMASTPQKGQAVTGLAPDFLPHCYTNQRCSIRSARDTDSSDRNESRLLGPKKDRSGRATHDQVEGNCALRSFRKWREASKCQ